MSLIDSTVGRKKIEILFAFWVPHRSPSRPREDNWKGMIVVRGMSVFAIYGVLGGGSMIFRRIWGSRGMECRGCGFQCRAIRAANMAIGRSSNWSHIGGFVWIFGCLSRIF